MADQQSPWWPAPAKPEPMTGKWPAPIFAAPPPAPPPAPESLVAPLPGGPPAVAPLLAEAAARFANADYLTATFDLNEPGMVDLYEAVVVPQWSRPFGAMLLSQLLVTQRPGGAHVLDVACGPGYPTLEIARFLGQDADIVGLDLWGAAIERGRRLATDGWLRQVKFLHGDILHTQLPELHFDLITCNLGYTSFADRGRALAVMARLTRPGGSLLLTTPLQTAFRAFLDLYHVVLSDLQLTNCVDALLALVKGRPTIASTRAAIERTGMVVEREVTERCVLTFTDARDFFTSPVIALSFLPGWRAIVPDLALRRVVFNEVERRLNARAAVEGHLTFDVPMLCLGARRQSP